MSTWYSDHYGTGSDQIVLDGQYKAPAGIGHARLRYKVAKVTALCLNTEHIRFMTFKSSDRIVAILISCDGASTAGDMNVGLHLTGTNHDGAVVDADLYDTTPLATAGALARGEAFTGGVLDDLDRGLTVWEQAAVGAATYTEDPNVSFDLTGTPDTSFTVASEVLTVEVWYTAGD